MGTTQTWMPSAGTAIIPTPRRTRWPRKPPTPGGCTTCRGMCGNGAGIGSAAIITIRVPRPIPAGPSSGSDRVIRGGGWYYGAKYCRSANRLIGSPNSRYVNIGFRLALSSTSTVTTAFSDGFDDGNFTSGPAWTAVNKDDYPGTVGIKDNALRLYRTGAGGNGGSVGIEIETDISVGNNTIVRFDGKAAYRSVGTGCGWTCGEFPVNVALYLEDASGNEMMVKYVLNYGDAIKDKDEATYKQISRSVPQGEWVRNISYTIRDAWSPASKITKVYLYGSGWD